MVKVGIIGAGFMGGMHAQAYPLLKNARLVAIADPRADKAKETADKCAAKVYSGADELIADKDIDVVDICVPTFMHKEYTLKAAAAGKHVLCEKPIALSLDEADEMIAACKKAGVKFMVAQVLRFWPEYVELKKIYDSGKLGKMLSLTCSRMCSLPVWSWEKWMSDAKRSGGAILDLHIHDVDYLYYLLGRPVSLHAAGTVVYGGYNHIWCTYKFKNDVTGFAEASWDVAPQFPFTARFNAIFEKGTVESDSRQEKSLTIYTADKIEHPQISVVSAEDAGGNISALGGYFEEIKYFVDCIDSDREPAVVTASDARNSLEVILAEMKSAQEAGIIKL